MKQLASTLSGDEKSELSVAFREMLVNSIEHGGKLDLNEWVRVSRIRTKRTIVYYIHDPGNGFSRADLKQAVSNPPDDPPAHMQIRITDNLRPGGFGLLLTSQLVDEVIHNQSGHEVILIKHLD